MGEKEYIPFAEWNKIQDEVAKTWSMTKKKVKIKNPRRVTQFARKR